MTLFRVCVCTCVGISCLNSKLNKEGEEEAPLKALPFLRVEKMELAKLLYIRVCHANACLTERRKTGAVDIVLTILLCHDDRPDRKTKRNRAEFSRNCGNCIQFSHAIVVSCRPGASFSSILYLFCFSSRDQRQLARQTYLKVSFFLENSKIMLRN